MNDHPPCILKQKSSDPHAQGPTQGERVEFVIPKAELASPFSVPLLRPAQPRAALVLQHPAGLELPYFPHFGDTVFLHLRSSPSSLSMTLGTKMALSRSRLVPARKPSACQALARHRRTSQRAREVLPFHGQSQNSHLIINHLDRARQAATMKVKIAVLPHTTCAPRGGREEVRG